MEDVTRGHYTLHGSLWDLSILAIPRILSALLAIVVSYHRLAPRPESPFDLHHAGTGERKSKAELEGEALEEPFLPLIKRYVLRMGYLTECSVLLTGILLASKCLARLNVEIGIFDEAEPEHPLFWVALALTGLFSLVEVSNVDSIEVLAGELGQQRRRESSASATWVERISESLAQPLLSAVNSEADLQQTGTDEEHASSSTSNSNGKTAATTNVDNDNARGYSDIGTDANYKAELSDLLNVCEPDKYLILLACVFLVCAAIANIYVPKYTGKILDDLVRQSTDDTSLSMFAQLGNSSDSNNGDDDSGHHGGSIAHIPGFVKNIEMLVLASILGGVFGGIRGALFTFIGARANVRLRIKLMDSLLSQEVGFFDTTRTGDITSRLSSDTTLVGSSITTNLNIFLRSTVQAAGVLVFMFFISWQLALLSFLLVPVISVLSKIYGRYLRRLSKLQQKKLADGNSVSESTLSSMATVRSFGAECLELAEFCECMERYLLLNVRTATATLGYSTCVGALPELVKALVLFYGGLLVQSDGSNHITGGQLISFILYLSYLSSAFSSLGGIYASLVRAVGAADKVFELMNRTPQMTRPTNVDTERIERAFANHKKGVLSVDSTCVIKQRAMGLYPETCTGEITLKDVQSIYPARPKRVVLDGMDLKISPGTVVALCGVSGSGKSSVVKLIQHLYEPSRGEVCIDGIPVQELSADWLCRNVTVVSQEPTLFARSVRRNIIYGLEGTDDEPSQEDVEEAARLANAASFIESLPQGYETEVGERGIQLSGGQKQRVAIARALVRKPRILLLDVRKILYCWIWTPVSCFMHSFIGLTPLIFSIFFIQEATSALDSESEHLVQTAIDDMISGHRSLDGDPSRSMTVVIIAHRLSTVRNADCIFVVEDGKVVEQGNHEELITKEEGVYSGLIRRQLGHSEDNKG
jgi:ATP-binding cassette subfamily B (MDR/TAP) protein 9